VKETEAILEGYWEGVLEETRRELAEQRGAGDSPVAGDRVKSKAAKRKQQKRKAQQQKKAPALAEAAAAAAAAEEAHGEGVAARQEEHGDQARQTERKTQKKKLAKAAMAAMGLCRGRKGTRRRGGGRGGVLGVFECY